MNTFQKLGVLMSMLFLLSAIPAMAQTDNALTFKAPFAFHAGDAMMPAGTYTMTPDDSTKILLIKSEDGSHSAFVHYEYVDSDTPASKTELTFNKYGETDFLNRISFEGQDSAIRIQPSPAEQNAAKAADAEQHSISAPSGQ